MIIVIVMIIVVTIGNGNVSVDAGLLRSVQVLCHMTTKVVEIDGPELVGGGNEVTVAGDK